MNFCFMLFFLLRNIDIFYLHVETEVQMLAAIPQLHFRKTNVIYRPGAFYRKRIDAFSVLLYCFSTNCIVGIKPLKILKDIRIVQFFNM